MRRILSLIIVLLLTACAAPKFTVDDGRKVDEVLLEHIQTYGRGERALRPAIVRTGALKDPECDTQFELPFSVASSDNWSEDDRVAWVRGLGVDERLTVVATSPGSGVQLRDRILEVGGYRSGSAEKMLLKLAELRDGGKSFEITLSTAKRYLCSPSKSVAATPDLLRPTAQSRRTTTGCSVSTPWKCLSSIWKMTKRFGWCCGLKVCPKRAVPE